MKYTIAMCSTFRADRYGEVMRALLLKQALIKRGSAAELMLFSPCVDAVTSQGGVTVYPMTQLEDCHMQTPFDAVVIGGSLGFDRDATGASLQDAWLAPIAFAVEHGVKVLFHAPHIPHSFGNTAKTAVAAAFRAAGYLSVRSASSSFAAELFDGADDAPAVSESPDPMYAVSDYFPEDVCSTIAFDGAYAVLQFDLQRPVTDDKYLAQAVSCLHDSGMSVMLLPLGSEQFDDTAMRVFNEQCGGVCLVPDTVPTFSQTAALLKNCAAFIGNDPAAAVTAMAFGAVAVAPCYGATADETQHLFEQYGVGRFAVSQAKQIPTLLEDYLAKTQAFEPKVLTGAAKVSGHYEAMRNALEAPTVPMPKAAFRQALVDVLAAAYESGELVDKLSDSLKQTENTVETLRGEIAALRAECAAKDVACANAVNDFQAVTRSFFWRVTSPFRRVSQALKNFIAKRGGLRKAAVYAKGFLRGGPKEAKKRVAALGGVRTTLGKLSLTVPKAVRREQEGHVFEKDVTFSILVPLYNTPTDFLEQMIQSVELQTYPKWELCLADGSDDEHAYVGEYCLGKAKSDPRIRYQKLTENKGISENTNACIAMATGNYIALFDHDDVLDPTVLYEYMLRICADDADFLYCDEDKFHEFGGDLYDANFKPDFAVDNLRSNNYICHFTVFKTSLLEKSGTFRKEFDGSQDHDMILRLTEQAQSIVHIPKVLYHWRVSSASVASDPYAKPYTILAGRKAVAEHLGRVGLKATVDSTVIHPNIYRIKYDIIGNPLVSIIIPNYNHVDELSRCIESIMQKSTYRNFEIIIVENNSNAETFAYYDTLKKYDNVKVVVYKPPAGFNYSAINNFGVQFASGEHYILLNNDVEIITPEWIEEMLMYSQREDVGAVGAMLYYPNDTIQHAGVTLGVLTLAGHNFKHSPRGNPGYFGRAGYQQNVTAVTAACVMIPASVYKEVDGLDETFEVAFNDIDLCMRIRQAGHLIVFTPFAELYHYESISRGDDETPEKRARFVSEVTRFQTRWKKELEAGDPYYNPNLTLDREDFSYKA